MVRREGLDRLLILMVMLVVCSWVLVSIGIQVHHLRRDLCEVRRVTGLATDGGCP